MIKVGFCVSYDWEFLKHSLPRVYKDADIICLAIDKDRHTWKCNPYEIDNDAFYAFVKEIDEQNKIDIYEDNFSLPELNSRENCNRHRTMIAERMGKGGWHIQVDSDEYFLDFKSFVDELKKIHKNPTGNEFPINVCCPIIPLYKKTIEGYLLVTYQNQLPEMFPMASNNPTYERARHNGFFNIYTKNWILHETWARGKDAMLFKLQNWGHSAEELQMKQYSESYYNLWNAIDEYNYHFIYNFHPANPPTWQKLSYVDAKNVSELLSNTKIPDFPFSDFRLNLKNSITYSRISKLFPFLQIK